MRTPRRLALLLAWMLWGPMSVCADDDDGPTTEAQEDVPDWATDNSLQLTLTPNKGHPSPLQYTVIPLTYHLGLNETDEVTRGMVHISGDLVATDSSNYLNITENKDIAFLSCDASDKSFISPDDMLHRLMSINPVAIVLYTTSSYWCSLSHASDEDLSFNIIMSMADGAEASQALSYLNDTDTGKVVKATISGIASGDDGDAGGGSHKSTVAMSVLYTITGLISLLFLVIIIVGALRAHRYPDRYGPRRALGGRARQSRAKGLARAVLDTIPIVKFGDRTPTKPDPDLELDTATIDGQDDAAAAGSTQINATNPSEEPLPNPPSDIRDKESGTPDDGIGEGTSNTEAQEQLEAGHQGCSICTEDFTVGEDVRVLPCSHQFHPKCVDPWLINVSGTCPLCRLDLRPGQESEGDGAASAADGDDNLPPPLALEGEEPSVPRSRFPRIFEINRLRQATPEERMAAIRRMQAETPEQGSHEENGEGSRQRNGLADKLREKFRIRTRAQPAPRR